MSPDRRFYIEPGPLDELCISKVENLRGPLRFWRADFSPRGTLVLLWESEAKASRGLKPALHDFVAPLLLCGAANPGRSRL